MTVKKHPGLRIILSNLSLVVASLQPASFPFQRPYRKAIRWIDSDVKIRDLTLNEPERSFRLWRMLTIIFYFTTWRDLEQGGLNRRCLSLIEIRDEAIRNNEAIRDPY